MASTHPDANSAEFLQKTLDSLQAHVAVLDPAGVILYTNRAWREFAAENGLAPEFCSPGVNHLRACDRAVRSEDADAAADGIRAVMAGEKPDFYIEYPCHSPETQRWFGLRVTRFKIGGALRVVVAHHTITERKLVEIALKAEQELLQNLIEVQEKEKQFLCHEFHDGMIQYAVGSRMMLEAYQSKCSGAEDVSQIATVIQNLQRGIEDARRVIQGIRPVELDESGLQAAIEDLVDQFSAFGITVTSNYDPQIGRLPESIRTTVYRIIQESLNNARKYSGADLVRIEVTKARGDLLLEVQDLGCGFDVQSARMLGFGLRGMAERVRLLGGEFRIESAQEAGTRVLARLPIPDGDPNDDPKKSGDAP